MTKYGATLFLLDRTEQAARTLPRAEEINTAARTVVKRVVERYTNASIYIYIFTVLLFSVDRVHERGEQKKFNTGIDHLLPSTEPSIDDEDAKELQMACFMGLLAFLADRPEVLRVSSLHMPTTFNAEARAIIQSAGVEETPLSDAGLDGTGEVVQVGVGVGGGGVM